MFLLTGSQQFSLMQGVTESLAGRAAILTLLPMSLKEQLAGPTKIDIAQLTHRWLTGGFPEIAVTPSINPSFWFASYLQTYLERDVRALRQVGDLGEFQTFLQAIAARNGQILKLSELSRDLGIAVNTVKAWIRVLEASQQIHLVRPYYKNLGKRLIKAPKLYFIDTGLYSHLVGLSEPFSIIQNPFAGTIMETAVFGELIKSFTNQGVRPAIYYWRTSRGEEIDFILEIGQKIIPIEVKSTKTPSASSIKYLTEFCNVNKTLVDGGYLICLADTEVSLSSGIKAYPFISTSSLVPHHS